MITDQSVGEEGKRRWSGKPKPPVSVDANTATPVGMVHESELAYVGMSFFQRGKFADLWAERFLFRKNNASDAGKSEIQYGNPSDWELFHDRRSTSNQYFGKMAGVGKRFSGLLLKRYSSRGI